MSRINTNVTSLIASRVLNTNTSALNTSLERLSTGLRINSGKDDPAGLIASENLRNQISGTEAAIKNAERADTIIATAEGSLTEVSSLLTDLQGLLSEVANSGGLSEEEIDANQMQIDSIINTIERIANTTEFEGVKLLNGNKAYTTGAVVATEVDELTINSAKLIDGAAMAINATVTTMATQGTITLAAAGSPLADAVTMQLSSNRGTTELSFALGATFAQMETAIDAVSEVTGVTAAVVAGDLVIKSVDYGSDAYATIDVTSGTSVVDATDAGSDVVATVNGVSATGDGKIIRLRTAMLDIEIDLDPTVTNAQVLTPISITGGGADFALGSTVTGSGLESIGLPNIAPGSLGNATDGYLSSLKSGGTNSMTSGNLYTAQTVLSTAVKDISKLRGRLGSFQKNTLQSTINSLNVANENLQSAESAIRDTDFATETSRLTRSQILVQAATSVLAQANYAPQGVLALLG